MKKLTAREFAESRKKRLAGQRRWYRKNRERVAEQTKEYYRKNKKRILRSRKKWASKNQDRIRNAAFLRLYKISLEDFEALLRKQKGRCAICRKNLKQPHVDHSHSTREVRGLLCGTCNLGLGHFKDDESLLKRAVAYLRNSK